MDHVRYAALVADLLRRSGLGKMEGALAALAGDGSDRPFFRFVAAGRALVAAFPSPTLPKAREEAEAAWRIGRHLARAGVPVPEPLAQDPASGLILFADLGDFLLLHVLAREGKSERAFALYQEAVEILARLQILAVDGFSDDWCWDTRRYDRQLMIERESNYFAREFCQGYLGMATLPAGLAADFASLAERVGACPAGYLLHRDYQSRNLMVTSDGLKVIDFQGARLGPLAYDLASLVNDPYAGLSYEWRRQLVEHYLRQAEGYIPLDQTRFMEDYPQVALQRNLQVLGAYAFLTRRRGKEFFRPYLAPALANLRGILEGMAAGEYPVLRRLVAGIDTGALDTAPGEARR